MKKLLTIVPVLAVMSGIAVADTGKYNGAQEAGAKGPVKLSEAEMEKVTASGYVYLANPSGIKFMENQGNAITTTEVTSYFPHIGGMTIISTPGGSHGTPSASNSNVYHVTVVPAP